MFANTNSGGGAFANCAICQLADLAMEVAEAGMETLSVKYICGIEVSDFSQVPQEFVRLRVPPQRTRCFFRRDHIFTIRSAFAAIWNMWLPELSHRAPGGTCFERYDDTLRPVHTGMGGVEIWIPLKARVGRN